MWFCNYCCTAFPGVKKVMVQFGSLEDRCSNLEKRVDKLEECAGNGKSNENNKEVCRQEMKEQNEIDKRKLNLMCFNLTESNEESVEERIAEDSDRIYNILEGPMKLSRDAVNIKTHVRLGIRKPADPNEPEKSRPIKFSVESFDM